VARARRRPELDDRQGDNHFDASLPPLAFNPGEAKDRLRKSGYKGERSSWRPPRDTWRATSPWPRRFRPCGGHRRQCQVEVFEYSVRAQRIRDRSFKGLWWSDPTSTLRDPTA